MEEIVESQGIDTWPTPVETRGLDKGLVRLSGLSQKYKRQAWYEIQQSSPELAQLLKDPVLHEMIELFEAELFVDASNAPCLPVEQLRGRSG